MISIQTYVGRKYKTVVVSRNPDHAKFLMALSHGLTGLRMRVQDGSKTLARVPA